MRIKELKANAGGGAKVKTPKKPGKASPVQSERKAEREQKGGRKRGTKQPQKREEKQNHGQGCQCPVSKPPQAPHGEGCMCPKCVPPEHVPDRPQDKDAHDKGCLCYACRPKHGAGCVCDLCLAHPPPHPQGCYCTECTEPQQHNRNSMQLAIAPRFRYRGGLPWQKQSAADSGNALSAFLATTSNQATNFISYLANGGVSARESMLKYYILPCAAQDCCSRCRSSMEDEKARCFKEMMRLEGPDREWELEVLRGWDRELRGKCEKWREETSRLAAEVKKREDVPGWVEDARKV
eukprot:g38182.t1